MRMIFVLPFRLVTPMFAFCLMAAPLAAQQITETFSHNANSFQMQFVKIGDAGNSGKNAGLSRPIGDVNYEYWIGKFEVDAWQIAVGNASGIVGVSVADWDHRGYTFGTNPPATGISWQEAARFVNWMNISKGYSPAYKFASYGPFNSYDPTYTGLNDMMMLWDPNDVGYNPNNPFRNSRARYFLPSLDEWFKAAFYDPTLNSGNGGYWDFPTTSNTAPTPVPTGAVGAVYDSQTGPANVDDAGSLSWYGTMAQGGNVYELAETAFDLNNNDINKNRAVVGGGWESPATQISSDFMLSQTPSAPNDSYGIGFRVAMVVEPPDSDLDQDGVNYYRELKDGTHPNDPSSFNPLSKGLVAYYPFDGNANDESGYSRHIETQGLDFAESRFCSEGSALALTKAFSASSTIYFDANTPRTFSQWVKVVDFPARTDPGWFKQDAPIAVFPQSVVLGNTFAADGEWWLDTGSGVAFYDFPLTTKWTQITVVYEGNVVEGKVYRNGIEVPLKSWVYSKTQFDSGDYNPLVGVDGIWNSTNTSANNLVDEVRIYNRALSSSEVKSLFYETAFTVEERSFLSASPSVMGHYSLAQYNANRTNGQIDVTENPSAFNLFTQQQFDSNRTAGQSDVINNPMTYGLYTSSSIMDLNLGGVMIQKQGSNVTLTLQVEKTDDLTSMPFEPYGTFLLPVSVPGNKSFLRIRALQP